MKTSIDSIFRLAVLVVVLTGAKVSAQETGDLKMTFVYGGDEVPERHAVKITADAAFCGKHDLKDPSLIVNPEGKGVANVIVYVYTGRRGGSKIDAPEEEPKTVELANMGCQFEPHVVVTRKGDTLKVTNPDPVGHNINLPFFHNKAENLMIPPGQFVEVKAKKAELGPIPFSCSIHPWMKGVVLVLDHPYVAVSDASGELTIKGLPTGKKLVFRANHERASIKEVEINGQKEKWKGSRFEVEIKPGMNDLGTIVIGEDLFK